MSASLTNEPGSDDCFEITFRPAKPVLDALVEMWKPLVWLDRHRRSHSSLFDPKRAGELIRIIPTGNRLAQAGALFIDAQENAAPEAWAHIAIGLMLKELGATVGDDYRCGIIDGAYRDPEVWGAHGPGFSAAVFVRSVREVRRNGALPTTGGFLNLCSKHRRKFRSWSDDLSTLQDLRYGAEDVLEQGGPVLRARASGATGPSQNTPPSAMSHPSVPTFFLAPFPPSPGPPAAAALANIVVVSATSVPR
jgi:hypothetical protein